MAYIRTGDIISYDIEARTLNITGMDGEEMAEQEIQKKLEERRKTWKLKKPPVRKGVLKRYTEHALSAMQGAGY